MTAVGGTSLATPAFPPVFFQTSLIHLLHESHVRRQKAFSLRKKVGAHLGGVEEKLGLSLAGHQSVPTALLQSLRKPPSWINPEKSPKVFNSISIDE